MSYQLEYFPCGYIFPGFTAGNRVPPVFSWLWSFIITCRGISPMVTSMKSTHGSVPFRHSVVRLYIAALCYI